MKPKQTKPTPTIIEAIHHKSLFGSLPAFEKLDTWAGWLVWLKAVFAIPIDADEIAIYRLCTGRDNPANCHAERGLHNRRPSWRQALHIGVNGRLCGLL